MTLFKFKKRRSAKYNQKSCKCFKHRKNSGMRNKRSAIRIKEKMQKAVRQKDYVRKLLETCKS